MDRKDALQVTVTVFGIYMGLGGIEHGIGEMLQGRQPPAGLFFPSWPDARFFRIVAGEPAMSVLPDLFVTGLFAVLFSLGFMAWSPVCTRYRYGGLFLMLLATAMLLCGAGIFPPIIGIFMGMLASARHVITGKNSVRQAGSRSEALWKLWLVTFSVCLVAFLLLFPGLSILDTFFGVNDTQVPAVLLPVALGMLLLASAFALFQQRFSAAQSPPLAESVKYTANRHSESTTKEQSA